MPRFIYRAKAEPGQIKEGVIEADSERAAVHKVSRMGYFPIDITPELPKDTASRRSKIGLRELSVFTRQLADLLGSGLTILKALDVLGQQTQNTRFRVIIEDMHGFVKEGGTFSGALMRHQAVFSATYVSMVKAAEAGGMLEDVLNRLADYQESQDQMYSRVRSALAYPTLMAAVGIITIIVLLMFVIPKLVTIFENIGQALPIATVILIKTSGLARRYGWIVLAVAIISVLIFKRQANTRAARMAIDNFKMRIFGIGPLIKKTEIARFARTLGMLLANGVPMMQSLQASALTVQNEVLRDDIETISEDVASGTAFSKAITKSQNFPPFAVNMIAVGDESGQLEKALLKVAESCERDVTRAVSALTALVEPFVIIIMGSIVGFIVISMLLPIFQINLMAR